MKIKVSTENSYDPYRRLLYEGGDKYLNNLITTNYNQNMAFQQGQVSKGFMDSVNLVPLEDQLLRVSELKNDLISENKINDEWLYPINTVEELLNHNERMGDVIISNPILRRRITSGRVKGFNRERWTNAYEDKGDEYYTDVYQGVYNGVVHQPSKYIDKELNVPGSIINKATVEDRYIVVEKATSVVNDGNELTIEEIEYALTTYGTIHDLIAKGRI